MLYHRTLYGVCFSGDLWLPRKPDATRHHVDLHHLDSWIPASCLLLETGVVPEVYPLPLQSQGGRHCPAEGKLDEPMEFILEDGARNTGACSKYLGF